MTVSNMLQYIFKLFFNTALQKWIFVTPWCETHTLSLRMQSDKLAGLGELTFGLCKSFSPILYVLLVYFFIAAKIFSSPNRILWCLFYRNHFSSCLHRRRHCFCKSNICDYCHRNAFQPPKSVFFFPLCFFFFFFFFFVGKNLLLHIVMLEKVANWDFLAFSSFKNE